MITIYQKAAHFVQAFAEAVAAEAAQAGEYDRVAEEAGQRSPPASPARCAAAAPVSGGAEAASSPDLGLDEQPPPAKRPRQQQPDQRAEEGKEAAALRSDIESKLKEVAIKLERVAQLEEENARLREEVAHIEGLEKLLEAAKGRK